jgi:metal-responsive CopG/Arc/MetJ family transcriptional regulator
MVGNTLETRGVIIMPGRKSKRMANITATLPIQLLDKIDEMIDEERAPSRSYVIREAVLRYLKEFEHK